MLYYKFKTNEQTIYVPKEVYTMRCCGEDDIEVRFASKTIKFKEAIGDNGVERLMEYLDNPEGAIFYLPYGTVYQTMDKDQVIHQLEHFATEFGIDIGDFVVLGRAAKVIRGLKPTTDRIKIYTDFTNTELLEEKFGLLRSYSKKIKGSVQRTVDFTIYHPEQIPNFRMHDNRILYQI